MVGLGEVMAAVRADCDVVDAGDVHRSDDHFAPLPDGAAIRVPVMLR
jgi:hypothetical protein